MSIAMESPPIPRIKTSEHPLMVVVRALASLKLTVVLLALSIFLVFVGTLAQIDGGIWTIVRDYFRSWFVWVPLRLFWLLGVKFVGLPEDWQVYGGFPFPGGWTIGLLMLVNLFSAHALRFRLSWKKLGVITLHAGVVVLMFGELAAGTLQTESTMTIGHGETVNFADDNRVAEFAIIDTSDGKDNVEFTIPESMLRRGGRIDDPQLPVSVDVVEYMPHTVIADFRSGDGSQVFTSTRGTPITIKKTRETAGVDTGNKSDAPSARIRILRKGTNEVIAETTVSRWFQKNLLRRDPDLLFPMQQFELDGKKYDFEMRGRREYTPFSLRLEEFRFDRYPGTVTPRNYSSRLVLNDRQTQSEREVLVRMNEPLTYDGATYYQSNFTTDEKGTMLQVTQNPGVLLPYVACSLVVLGMLIHFTPKLLRFLSATAGKAGSVSVFRGGVARAIIGACAFITVGVIQIGLTREKQSRSSEYDYEAFGRLPVQDGGRIKPLDTVARVALATINSKQDITDAAGHKLSPSRWLIETMALDFRRGDNDLTKTKMFRIENVDVVNSLGLEPRPLVWRYSLVELRPHLGTIDDQSERAVKIDSSKRSLIDQKVIDLRRHLGEFLRINAGGLAVIPPERSSASEEWTDCFAFTANAIDQKVFKLLDERKRSGQLNVAEMKEEDLLALFRAEREKLSSAAPPAARDFLAIISAYRGGDPRAFNEAVASFSDKYGERVDATTRQRVDLEVSFNRGAPFFYCMYYYLVALLLVFVAWFIIGLRPQLANNLFIAAFGTAGAAFVVHLISMIARMYLMDRPLVFVTNLYSSAIFIGCVAGAMGLIVELIYGRGIGTAVGAVAASLALFVGYYIDFGMEGDKLEMMQAVLDTNFWLATHVTTVTTGYAATMVAGLVGVAYVALGIFSQQLNRELGKTLSSLIYGIVCFATLFSFTGTVLGGIWADYSWGRFWGWDPKENGAMLIVLWNALVLHARWGGLVKARGVAVLSIAGIAVTAWSWFGTNQLGVGLHAYGFTSAAATAITSLVSFVVVCVGVGALVPHDKWLSHSVKTA